MAEFKLAHPACMPVLFTFSSHSVTATPGLFGLLTKKPDLGERSNNDTPQNGAASSSHEGNAERLSDSENSGAGWCSDCSVQFTHQVICALAWLGRSGSMALVSAA